MNSWLSVLLAHAAVIGFGAPAAWHPALRHAGLPTRLAAAFAFGAVALTAEALVWSFVGIRWSVVTLALPLAAGAAVLTAIWARRPAVQHTAAPPSTAVAVVSGLAVVAALAHLVLATVSSLGNASDLLLFWGVKGLAFAEAGSLDATSLSGPFAFHTHVTYPPLYPSLLAWTVLVGGAMPWQVVPVTSAFYLGAALPLVVHLLRRRLGTDMALAVATFWTAAMAVVLVRARSGGNAEAALLLYETLAVAGLLSEERADTATWAVALGLTGAMVTKNEGAVAVSLLLVGIVLRAVLGRRRLEPRRLAVVAAGPLLGFAAWLGFRALHHMPLSDPIRERVFAASFAHLGTILAVGADHLDAGTRGLSWLVPLAILVVAGRRRLVAVLPALCLTGGLFAFLLVYYLHAEGDPSRLVSWTLPRLTIPALSALILAAGVASAPSTDVATHPSVPS